jgi:hypothetical protein
VCSSDLPAFLQVLLTGSYRVASSHSVFTAASHTCEQVQNMCVQLFWKGYVPRSGHVKLDPVPLLGFATESIKRSSSTQSNFSTAKNTICDNLRYKEHFSHYFHSHGEIKYN